MEVPQGVKVFITEVAVVEKHLPPHREGWEEQEKGSMAETMILTVVVTGGRQAVVEPENNLQ